MSTSGKRSNSTNNVYQYNNCGLSVGTALGARTLHVRYLAVPYPTLVIFPLYT